MEGTISLGIYDAAGKLVRVLHRESEVTEFTSELNGLVTHWDGADDQGVACPPGKYHAHGYMVGELEIEGVDFIGNDWVNDADDTLRISRITELAMSSSNGLLLKAMVPGQPQPAVFGVVMSTPDADGESEPQLGREPNLEFPEQPRPDRWQIVGNSLNLHSVNGEVLRTITAKPEDPIPIKLTASLTEDKVYLLEENTSLQRLRCLDFTGVAPAGEPKVVFEQTIQFSDRYEQIADELTYPDEKPFVPAATLTLSLVPNPLFQDKPGSVEVAVKTDKTGSFFAATDGLPLVHISETPNLRWAVMGREVGSKLATIFQSDGAVVEEFTAGRLANMMAFDAGEFEWSPATPAPSAAP